MRLPLFPSFGTRCLTMSLLGSALSEDCYSRPIRNVRPGLGPRLRGRYMQISLRTGLRTHVLSAPLPETIPGLLGIMSCLLGMRWIEIRLTRICAAKVGAGAPER